MRPIYVTLCLLTASACSHPALSSRGSEVILLAPSATPACERIASVVGKSWGSVGFGDTLLASAENSLRNRAGEAGATHVVATRHDPSAHAYFLEGDAYHCGPPAAAAPAPAAAAPAQDANGAALPATEPSPADATPSPPAAPTP